MLRAIAVAALITLAPTATAGAAAVDFAPQNFHPWPEHGPRPDNGEAKLAGAYFHDAPAALDAFAAELKADPKAIDAAADYAALQRQLGFAAASVHTYRQLAASQPGEPRWRRELGWAEYEAGDPAAAAADFAAALAAAPGDPWSLMGAGLTDYALDRMEVAAAKLQAAVDADARLGLAYKILGELAEATGDAQTAIEQYRRALGQDGSYVSLYFEIAKLEERTGDYASALHDLNVAVRISPRDPAVTAAAEAFKKAHPDLIAATKARLESRPAPVPPKVAPAPEAPHNPLIRVGVEQGRKEQRIVCGGGFTVTADGASVQGVGGFSYRLVATDGGVTVLDSSGQTLLAAKGPIELTPLDPTDTFVLLDVVTDRGYFWSTQSDRAYRGKLRAQPNPKGGFDLIDILPLEAYLLAVVPSEAIAGWPQAALEAQAIAARTYTITHLHQYGANGFDVVGSTLSAAYRGVTWEHPNTTRAVGATAGLILTYHGRPIDAVFSSNAGGITASSQSTWGGDLPYLQSVADVPSDLLTQSDALPGPFHLERWLKSAPISYDLPALGTSTSGYRWARYLAADEVSAALPELAKLGALERIAVVARDDSGRATRVAFIGAAGQSAFTASRVQSALRLRSRLFTIETRRDAAGRAQGAFVFGGGWGHGVGLSQVGAAHLADAGADAAQILQHYYPGATITPYDPDE